VSAITLGSGKELKENRKNREVEHGIEVNTSEPNQDQDATSNVKKVGEDKKEPYKPLPPFSSRPRGKTPKVDEANQEILEIFRKVEINIPLLDAIQQVSRYAKFLRELCTAKRKLKGNEKLSVGENMSTIFQNKLPPKFKNPGVFSIPCKIENLSFDKAMLDVGASINAMPRCIYDKPHLGELNKIDLVI